MPLIDLSHTVEHGMITYKGLPAPIVCDYLSREESRTRYAAGTEFHIGRIDMVANTGTYIDSPFHRYADGIDLSELRLESLANLPAIVIRANDRRQPAIDAIPTHLDLGGAAVLFQTGWDAHWRTDQYFEGHPHLTAAVATQLVERRRRPRGHRLIQHRFHREWRTPGAFDFAPGRHPYCGAPLQSQHTAGCGRALLRGAGESERHGNVSSPRLRALPIANSRRGRVKPA